MIIDSQWSLRSLLEQMEIKNIKEYEDDNDYFIINVSDTNIHEFITTLKEEIREELRKEIQDVK